MTTDESIVPPTYHGISLTPAAAAAAALLQAENESFRDLPLRLYIEGKGCDGFFYGVTFDPPTPDDRHFASQDVEVIVDERTLLFCDGCLIDWVDDERGRGFLVENPSQKRFRGKFFKKEFWRNRLEQMT